MLKSDFEKKTQARFNAVSLLLSPYFRIAANEPSFMSTQLKILDQRHKQKLNLKALDAVLFGPPLRKYAISLTWMLFMPIALNKTISIC